MPWLVSHQGCWSPGRSKDWRPHGPQGCHYGRCWEALARWQLVWVRLASSNVCSIRICISSIYVTILDVHVSKDTSSGQPQLMISSGCWLTSVHLTIHGGREHCTFYLISPHSSQILSILSKLHEASWFQNANSLFTFCLSGVFVFFTKIKVARGVAEAAWPQAPSATTFDNWAFRMRSWWPSWVPWHGGLVAPLKESESRKSGVPQQHG